MAITYDPKKMLGKIAPEKKIKKILSSKVTLKRTALSFLNDADFIDKSQVTDVALKTVRGYKERIKKEESELSSKYKYSPDKLKQYGYKTKSSGLTALSEKMPEGPDTALIEYSENKFKAINSQLRSNKLTGDSKEYIADIDKSFDVSVMKGPRKLYRGVKGDFSSKDLKVGSSFKDSSYLSTSPDKDVASAFAKSFDKGNGVLFEIEVAAGDKAVDLTSIKAGITKGESEILLPRDSELEILSIEEKDGLKIVKARTKLAAEKEDKAESLEKDIVKNPKQLVQRVQNEIAWQVKEGIKTKYRGEMYEWLPSSADEPDPEHQANYGQVFEVGVGEMPGDRYGCQCGMRILVDEEKLELE